MASPAFRAFSDVNGAVASNITVTKPTGTVDNDIIIVGIGKDDNVAPGIPAGWTLLESGLPAALNSLWVYWKRAASEGADWTWTFASVWREAACSSYSGVPATGSPFDPDLPAADVVSASANSLATNNNTTLTADTCVIVIGENETGNAWNTPAGYTLRGTSGTDPNGEVMLSDKSFVGPGEVGAATLSMAGTGPMVSYMLVLRSMEGITYRAGTSATGTGTSITINKPAGVVAGDVMIARIVSDADSAAARSGWTQLGNLVVGFLAYNQMTILRRVADGTEGASFLFTTSLATISKGTIDAFIGVDNTTPEDATTPAGVEDTVATVTFPSITPVTDKSWHLAFVSENVTTRTFTTPTNYTARTTANADTLFTRGISPAAVVTGVTSTDSASPYSHASFSVALRPAIAAAPVYVYANRRQFNYVKRGVYRRWHYPQLPAAMTPGTVNTNFLQSVVGALSFIGVRIIGVGAKRLATLSFAASAARAATRLLTAQTNFVGAAARQAGRVLVAGLSFVAVAAMLRGKGFAATLSFVGAAATQTAHRMSGVASFLGGLPKQTGKPLGQTYLSAVLVDSPLAYWRLDETVGLRAMDTSGSNHTALHADVVKGATGALATQVLLDDFNRADSADIGANWTENVGNMNVVTNAAEVISLVSSYALIIPTATAQPNIANVAVSAKFVNVQNSRLYARSDFDLSNYYFIGVDPGSGNVLLYKTVAGVEAILQTTAVTVAVGDVWRLEVYGTQIRVYQNGVQRGSTVTDTGVTIAGRTAYLSFNVGSRMDDYKVEDLTNAAMTLNGTTAYGSSEATLNLSSYNKITVEFWAKTTSTTGDRVVLEMSTNYNSVTDSFIAFFEAAGTWVASFNGPAGYESWRASRAASGQWGHFVVTFDRTQGAGNCVRVYLDGVAVGSATASTGGQTGNFGNRTVYLGARAGTGLFFDGTLDEVAVYGGILSQERITAHYSAASKGGFGFVGRLSKQAGRPVAAILSFTTTMAQLRGKLLAATLTFIGTVSRQVNMVRSATLTFVGTFSRVASLFRVLSALLTLLSTRTGYRDTILQDAPKSYWRLDDAVKTHNSTAVDEMAALNAVYQAPYGESTNGHPGRVGGGHQYIVFGATTTYNFPNRDPMSIEFWYRPWLYDNETFIVFDKVGWGMVRTGVSVLAFSRGGASLYTGTVLSRGRWTHIAVTYDGTTAKIYVDAVEKASASMTGNNPSAAAAFSAGGFNLDGQNVDEVAIYDFALSATQVQTHHRSAIGPTVRVGAARAAILSFTTTMAQLRGKLLAAVLSFATGSGPSIGYRGGSSATGSVSTLVITIPGNVRDGDAMYVTMRSLAAFDAPPTGWTLLASRNLATGTPAALYRRIASAEPASYTWNSAGSTGMWGVLGVYSGVNSLNPEDVTTTIADASNITVTWPDITPVVDNAWHFATVGSNAGGMTTPTNYTARLSRTIVFHFDRLITPPALVTGVTATGGTSEVWVAFSVMLRPVPNWRRDIFASRGGTLSFAGGAARRTSTLRAATLSFAGATARRVGALRAATLSFIGTIARTSAFGRVLAATLSFLTGGGGGSVSYQNSASTSASDLATSTITSFDPGTGANRVLIVTMALEDDRSTTMAVTFGGVALTLIPGTRGGAGASWSEQWGLINPSSTPANIVASWTTISDAIMGAVAVNGADQTAPFQNGTQSHIITATISLAIASATGNLTLAGGGGQLDWTAPTQTQRWNHNTGLIRGGGSTAPGAASVTHQWTTTDGFFNNISGVDIKKAASSGGLLRDIFARRGGTLSFAAVAARLTSVPRAATLSFAGAMARVIAARRAATLTFVGATGTLKSLGVALAATLSFVGSLPRNILARRGGTLSFAATAARRTSTLRTATLSFVGSISRLWPRALTATLSFAGTQTRTLVLNVTLVLSTLSFVGALPRRTGKAAPATLAFVATQARRIEALRVAVLSFVGAAARRTSRALPLATLSFLGATAKRTARALPVAIIQFAGVLRRQANKAQAATLSFVAVNVRRVTAVQGATLTFLGAKRVGLTTTRAATLSFVGAIARERLKAFAATLSFVGTAVRGTTAVRAATLTFSGAKRASVSSLRSATLSFVGVVSRGRFVSLAAALSFIGDISTAGRSLFALLEGVLTFSGVKKVSVEKRHSATLTPVGRWSRQATLYRAFSAALSFVTEAVRSYFITSTPVGQTEYRSDLTAVTAYSRDFDVTTEYRRT